MSGYTFISDIFRKAYGAICRQLERARLKLMLAVYRKAAYRITIDLSPQGARYERRLWDEAFEKRLDEAGIQVLPRLFRMTDEKALVRRRAALLGGLLFKMSDEMHLCGPDWSVTISLTRSGRVAHIRWEGEFCAELPPDRSLLRMMLSLQKPVVREEDRSASGGAKARKGPGPAAGGGPEADSGRVVFHRDRMQAQRAAQKQLDQEMAAFLEQG